MPGYRKKKHLAFVKYPKIAGTFIKAYMQRYTKSLDVKVTHTYGEINKHSPVMNTNRFYTFTFVRNPWAWQVSYYFHYCQSPQNPNRHLFVARYPTFDEWVHDAPNHNDVHKRVFGGIYSYMQDFFIDNCYLHGNLMIDYVGTVENLNYDVRKILILNNCYEIDRENEVGTPEDFYNRCDKEYCHIRDTAVNKTEHDHYSTYYTEETKELIRSNNEQLIGMFQYQFEEKPESQT